MWLIRKYRDGLSDLSMGIIFILISILLFIGRDKLYKDIVSIVVLILSLLSFFQLLRYLLRKLSVKDSSKTFLSCIFNFFVCLVMLFLPNLSFGLLPFIFSLYLFLLGTAQFIMCFLMFENNGGNKIRNFLWGTIYYLISIPILLSPVNKIETFLFCFAFYILLLGINFIYDFFNNILSRRIKNKLKRKIRITLPKVFESIIPYSVMIVINKSLDTNDYRWRKTSRDKQPNLFLLDHTYNRGVNKIGHMDIYFDGAVISYGSYDEGSRKFREIFGDGVVFKTYDRKSYINFCIDNSDKTLFEFGLSLSDRQKEKIRARIDDIFSNAYLWDYKTDKKYNNGTSYAAKLYKKTKAKFYKFKSGKYKTFFVMGSNCCYLVDDIVGHSGIDLLSLNGIIAPGTYYDYLEKESHRKNGIVVSKNIYNSNSRCR